MKLTITLAQINIQIGKPFLNFDHCIPLINEAAKRGSSLVLLPELWTSGYDLQNAAQYSHQNQLILNHLSKLAKELNITIAGSLLKSMDKHNFNSFTIISNTGHVSTGYQKIHLFRLMDEHLWLSAGDQLFTTTIAGGKCAATICYDLRFPEIFRNYAVNGAQIFLLPAEWPQVRILHWKTLIRARAIENQAFMFAVNCVGKTGSEVFGGCSAIISPGGETVVESGGDSEDLITAEIDINDVEKVRKLIPIFDDRRPGIYDQPPINE